LAYEFMLPIRLESSEAERTAGFPFRQLAADEGVLSPDHFRQVRSTRRAIERLVFDLAPGVTEVLLEPAIDTPELRALDPEWATRVDDLQLVTRDSGFRALVERAGARFVGYRALRDAQRKG